MLSQENALETAMHLNIWLILILLLTGCASYTSLDAMNSQGQTSAFTENADSNGLNSLTQVYKRYEGTPYRYGGTNENGFDCSGFIQTAMLEAFGVSIPRTTEQLANSGVPVRRDQLQAGDVVIFRSSLKQLHAGIYMANDRFIHASESVGVTQSKLDNTYWLQRYIKARRYL